MQEQKDKRIVGMKGVLSGGQQKLKKLKDTGKSNSSTRQEVWAEAQRQKKRKGNIIFNGWLGDNSPVQEINTYFTNLGVCRLQLRVLCR